MVTYVLRDCLAVYSFAPAVPGEYMVLVTPDSFFPRVPGNYAVWVASENDLTPYLYAIESENAVIDI